MMKKDTWRIVALCAGMAVASMANRSHAADEPAPQPTPPAQPAQPTPPTDQQRPRRNPAEMLKNFRDQFEGLNLSDEQMKKIDGFLTTAEAEAKNLAGKEDQESRDQMRTAFGKLNEDVQSVLTDDQKTALRAKRQAMMFDGFSKAYTNPKLMLTDDQTKQINAVLDDAKKQLTALTGDNRDDRRKIMRDSREKLNSILTPDQQKLIPQFGGRGGRGNRNGGTGAPGGGAGAPPAPPAQ